jgi:hypothetical protein
MVALFGGRVGVCICSRGLVVSLALALPGKLRDVGNEGKEKSLGCRAVFSFFFLFFCGGIFFTFTACCSHGRVTFFLGGEVMNST